MQKQPAKFERFDIFQRPKNENRIQTPTGGFISVVALCIIIILVISEFSLSRSASYS